MITQRFRLRTLPRLGALSLLALALLAGGATAPALAAAPSTVSTSTAANRSAAPTYIALGDSFTAGQGAPPYVQDGTVCLRSKYQSYPAITSLLSQYRLTANKACSGADATAVAAQLSGVNPATTLVTITVGGIDAGSNQVLAACAPNPNTQACGEVIASSVALLTELGPKLVATYSLVAQTLPNAQVAVLNYPPQFAPGFSEFGDVVNEATGALNLVIAGAVAATDNPRVVHVDSTQEFAGHGIGSRVSYFSFDAVNLFSPANFHPNARGNSFGYYAALVNDGLLRR